jgi:hypothetical protein
MTGFYRLQVAIFPKAQFGALDGKVTAHKVLHEPPSARTLSLRLCRDLTFATSTM